MTLAFILFVLVFEFLVRRFRVPATSQGWRGALLATLEGALLGTLPVAVSLLLCTPAVVRAAEVFVAHANVVTVGVSALLSSGVTAAGLVDLLVRVFATWGTTSL
jgi:hypothetical protein